MQHDSRIFSLTARVLHWLMAAMIVAMIFIGIGMVASVSERHLWLVRLHKPLGIAILVLAVVRLTVRLRHRPPALPRDLSRFQVLAARMSHGLLYTLMFAMPLIGWAMLSAGGYPVMLSESLRLPSIFPVSAGAFAVLRHLHGWLATLLFLTFLGHMAAALYHGLIRRDGVLSSMTVRRARWQHDQPQVSGGDPASARLPMGSRSKARMPGIVSTTLSRR
jgi:cytochrome b561